MDTTTLHEVAYRPADTTTPLLEQTVGDILRAAAAAAPDRVAVLDAGPGGRRAVTYAELLAGGEQVARALLARFRPGEHVAVWAGNGLEWILLEYGAGLAGLVLVTVNPAYQAAELEYVLRTSHSVGLFHMAQFRGNPMAATVESVRPALPTCARSCRSPTGRSSSRRAAADTPLPAVTPGDDVQIQYTSGTTGFPKGVLLHHRGLVNNAHLSMARMAVTAGDVLVWPMPLFHTAGCGLGVLGAASVGATLVLLAQFDPGLQLALIESERATHQRRRAHDADRDAQPPRVRRPRPVEPARRLHGRCPGARRARSGVGAQAWGPLLDHVRHHRVLADHLVHPARRPSRKSVPERSARRCRTPR